MAIDREVKIIISAVDDYSSTLEKFGGLLGGIGTAAVEAQAAIAGFSLVLANFTIGIGQSAVQAAADFNDAIFDVSAVVGKAGASTEEIGNILDRLVAKFPVTGAQAGQALESIAQFGFGAADQLENITDAAIELQIATGTELNTSVSALTSTLSQFGLEVTEVSRVSNVLAATQFNSAASVSDLREALKFAGPTANLFNMGLEETVATLALLRKQGLDASQTGTVFRGALVALTKETEKGTTALANYGLTYKDVNPATKNSIEILNAFKGQTISATDAVALFGVEASQFAGIINNESQAIKELTTTITGTNSSTDAARQKSEKWSIVLNNLGGTLDVFKKTIGEELLPVLIEFVGKDENSGIRGVISQLLELEKSGRGIGGPLVEAFNALRQAAQEVFDQAFQGNIQNVYKFLSDISTILSQNIQIMINLGAEFVKGFVDSTSGGERLEGILKIINTSLTSIALIVATVHDAFTGWYTAATLGVTELQVIFNEFLRDANKYILDLQEGLNTLPFVDLQEEIAATTQRIQEYGKKAAEGNAEIANREPIDLWVDNVLKASVENIHAIEQVAEKADSVISNLPPAEIKVDSDQAIADFEEYGEISRLILEEEARIVEKVGEKIVESNKRTLETINKEQKKSLELRKETYKGATDEINELEKSGVISAEEANQRKAEAQEEYNSSSIEAAQARVDTLKEFYSEDIENFKSKTGEKTQAEKDENAKIIEVIKNAEAEVTRLKQQAEEDRKKNLETRLTDIENSLEKEKILYEQNIADINLLEAEGRIDEEESLQKRLEAQETYLNDKISKTQEAYDIIKENYPEDVERQKEAYQAVKDVQREFTEFKIQKIEEEREALKSSLEEEISIRQANYEIATVEIEKQEARGVISVENATNQKRAIEEDFLNFKIQKLSESIQLAASQYGQDSEEYANAVLAKKQAELELIEVKQAVKEKTDEVTSAEKEAASASSELSRQTTSDFQVAGEKLEMLFDRATNMRQAWQIPVAFFVDIDPATQSLNDLNLLLDNARINVAEFAGSYSQRSIASAAKNDMEAIKALQQQFQSITVEAANFGLKVDVLDQTLEEAAADVEARIEGWTNFKDTLTGLSGEISILTEDYGNFTSSVDESATQAADSFNDIVDSASKLQEGIKQVNEAFGSGNIEAAEKMADGVIGAYEEIYDQATDILDDLKSEWQSLADEIDKINGKIVDIQQTTEEKIREARRETMTELEQFQDIRLEYDEVYAQAQQESAKGNFEAAAELYEKAADLAGELQTEIKDESGEVVKSLEQNTTLSIDLMQKASDAAVSVLQNQNDSLISQQSLVEDQIKNTTDVIGGLGNQIDSAFSGIADRSKDIVNIGNQIGSSFSSINNQIGGMTSSFMRLSDLVKQTSQYNIDFTGTGSSKLPLSEKIAEIQGKVIGFADKTSGLKPKIEADFSNVTSGIGTIIKSIEDFPSMQDTFGELSVSPIQPIIPEEDGETTEGLSSAIEEGIGRLLTTGGLGQAAGFDTEIGGAATRDALQSLIESNSYLLESQEKLTDAIRQFGFPERFVFNVEVNSNGEEWLRGLTKSLIDQIFVEAEAEQFNVFGQEG